MTKITQQINQIQPYLLQVKASNKSAFTFDGTNSYVINGKDQSIIIDPGPLDKNHLDNLIATLGGNKLTAIICTHRHTDHVASVNFFRKKYNCPIMAYPTQFKQAITDENINLEKRQADNIMVNFDACLFDNQEITLNASDNIKLKIHHTAGHTDDHVCIGINDQYLLTGDHLMSWSTSIIIAPCGDLGDYLASLKKIFLLPYFTYLPGHGEIITKPRELIKKYYRHRLNRLKQLKKIILQTPQPYQIFDAQYLSTKIYPKIDKKLFYAAIMMVYAHLLYLEKILFIENVAHKNVVHKNVVHKNDYKQAKFRLVRHN